MPVSIANLDISNCTDSGVVVNLTTSAYQVDMLYFSLHHNSGLFGAGLKVVTGSATLNYIDISNNSASRNGGGLFVDSNACVTFEERFHDSAASRFTFAHNRVEGKGGAIYMDRPNCAFATNPSLSLYVRDARFSNNTAQQAGGAVYLITGNPVLQEPAAQLNDWVKQAVSLGFVRTDFIGNKVRRFT
jgi:predicted outer membrane repeat protein